MATVTQNINIVGFFNERTKEIKQLKQILQSVDNHALFGPSSATPLAARRTRSFKRYQLSRQSKLHPSKLKLKKRRIDVADRCRKHRRRPHTFVKTPASASTLLRLGTHHWAARRMHMTKRWGYILPICNASCGTRAVGKALKERAVLHDSSYLMPVQTSTSITSLLTVLPTIMDPALSASVLSSAVLASQQEARIVLHCINSFPVGAIGPVTMFVTPPDDTASDVRNVWFWCHPAVIDDVESVLRSAFDMAERVSNVSRLTLIGSCSLHMLANVLQPPPESDLSPAHEFLRDVPNVKAKKDIWVDGALLSFDALDCRQLSFAKGGKASIRQSLNSQWKLSTESVAPSSSRHVHMPSITPLSTLWCAHRLQQSNDSMPADTAINTMRYAERKQRKSMFGSDVFLPTNISAVALASFPVAIVKRTSGANASIPLTRAEHSYPIQVNGRPQLRRSVAQYDIMVPSQWLRVVWQAFIFAGAMAVGLDEMEVINTLQAQPSFPRDFLDTPAGQTYWREKQKAYQTVVTRRPKNKRKCVSSIGCFPAFSTLWSEEERLKPLAVVRNSDYVDAFLPPQLQGIGRYYYNKSDVTPIVAPPTLPFRTLVQIFLRCTGRGVPAEGAALLCPATEDYASWLYHRSHRQDILLSGKRIGDWRGLSADVERNRIGYVTHGLQSPVSDDRIAVGYMDVCKVHEMMHLAQIATSGVERMLVLYHCSRSGWIHPALFDIVTL